MRLIHLPLVGALLAAAGLLAGCGEGSGTPTATPIIAPTPAPILPTPTPLPTPTQVQLPTPDSLVEPPTLMPVDAVKPGPEKAIALARAALATRLGVDAASITVVQTTPMEWPNSALGCPEPGRAYAQVVTPGYIVELAQGDTHYIYHAGANGGLATCSDATP
jgi:hypothetical protein